MSTTYAGVHMKAFFSFNFLNLLKKYFLTPLIFAHFILLSFSSVTQSATGDDSSMELRIAYLAEQSHFHESYSAKEHSEQRFKILSKYIKNPYTFVPVSFQQRSGLELLNSGKVNIISAFIKSPQRMFQLKFSKNPFFSSSIYIVARKGQSLTYGDLAALKGQSIAIMSANTDAKVQLDEFLTKNNITMNYKIYEDNQDFVNSEALFKLTSAYYMTDNQRIVARIGEQGLYFATLPKLEYLLDIIDNALEQANKHDANALRVLNEKYIVKDVSALHHGLNKEELHLAKNDNRIYHLAYLDNHYPIQYVNNNGDPAGITIRVLEIFKQMHQNSGVLTSYNLNDAIDLKQFDMIFSVVGNTKLKQDFFHISNAYLNLPMVLFQKSKEQTISCFGMLDYSTLNHEEVQKNFPLWKMCIFKSLDELFAAYEMNKIHAVFFSNSEAGYAIGRFGLTENKLVPTTMHLPLRFYLSKKYPIAALNILNSYISNLNPVALQKVIYDENRSIHAPSTAKEFLVENKTIVAGAVALVLSIMLSLHFLRLWHTKRQYSILSLTDALTGLHTKEKAFAIMQRSLKTAKPGEYIVFCVDIDKFILLNQVYGAKKANDVLCYLATHHKNKYGKSLHAKSVARLGADILLVFGKVKDIKDALDNQEDALILMQDIKGILNNNYTIGLSRGCYIIDDVTLPIETMIGYCGAARHACKSEHGLTSLFFDEEMKQNLEVQKSIIYKMESALENQEFILDFQPKVRIDDEQICGAEVLVRWQAEHTPTIYPKDFISIFEKSAFITNLDMYVFEKTCQFISKNKDLLKQIPLAVNFSSITILHIDTIDNVKNIVDAYEISADEIDIEITESAIVVESEAFIKVIEQLCELGFNVAIDDFGTGVSSLHRLSSLSIQAVKLDKAFLDDKFATKKGVVLVASIIAMLKKLNMQVVAEGVETKFQLEILRRLKCDVVQGYYFHKPMPDQDFAQLLKSVQDIKI